MSPLDDDNGHSAAPRLGSWSEWSQYVVQGQKALAKRLDDAERQLNDRMDNMRKEFEDKLDRAEERITRKIDKVGCDLDGIRWKVAGIGATVSLLVTIIVQVIMKQVIK